MIGVYVTTFFLLAGFSAVLVAAGHGVGPVGMLMVMGDAAPWYFGMALGWPGWALILGSLAFSDGMTSRKWQAYGLALVVMSWCVFVSQTEDLSLTLITSVPFLVATVVRVTQLGRK